MTIPDTLAALTVPVDTLRPYGRNPRRGNLDAIRESLQHHGQYRPLVVNQRTNEVLAGNHTLHAAQQLGWTEIAVTYVDVDEEQAARIVLVDNRTNDLAGYDDTELAGLLEGLPTLDGTAWGQHDLDKLLAKLDGRQIGDERYTPAWIFEAMGLRFDLDVAAPLDADYRVVPADAYLTVRDDGLTAPWDGLVWMNPPYSQAAVWAQRWIDHSDGVCLLPMVDSYWTPGLLASSVGFVLLPGIEYTTPFAQTAGINLLAFLAARGTGEPGLQRLADAQHLRVFSADAQV
ncbi:MAG TPA: DNA N-6-adenine-methyltransferase [Acidimicrobiales bacterium]|nr:DNA N-6-adenine-methyltransferase [Acidimicrobiales bacterium]